MQKNLLLISLLVIFLLGAYLRVYHYSDFPPRGATMDEFAWAWQGISLIKDKMPSSWSYLPVYKNYAPKFYEGNYFPIVTPYLDHPPLFGLLIGGFSLLRAEGDFSRVTLETIRIPMIVLGVISLGLVFLLAQKLFGSVVAWIATFFYATNPSIVLSSRVVVSENLLIPLSLLGFYFLINYFETNETKWRNLAAVIAGVSLVVKIPGVFIGLAILTLLAFKKRWRDFYWVGFSLLSFFSLYLVYGLWFGGVNFFQVFFAQAERVPGPATILKFFTQPTLIRGVFSDGLLLWGWFSILTLASKWKKNKIILIIPLLYLVVLLFMAPQYENYGWYNYPFYPFLVMAGAKVLIDSLIDNNLFLNSLFFLTAFLSAFHWGSLALFSNIPSFLFRAILILGIASYLSAGIWSRNKKILINVTSYCALILIAIFNVLTILEIGNLIGNF